MDVLGEVGEDTGAGVVEEAIMAQVGRPGSGEERAKGASVAGSAPVITRLAVHGDLGWKRP